jgi:TolA-binding protein
MAFIRRWLLTLSLLALGSGQLFAATREERDFAAAAAAFKDGMWSRAEVDFAEFIEKHPDSPRVPEAALMQAQADYKQGKVQEAITLLQSRESSAGNFGDQFLYWIGQAQLKNADYDDARDTFAKLASDFPASQWRLDSVINQAAAEAKLGQWSQIVDLLQKPDEVFQNAVKTNATDDRVLNGRLLLAEALLSQNHPGAASSVLESSAAFKLNPELDWRRLSLLSKAQWAGGNTNAALDSAGSLVDVANRANRPDLRAESVTQQAELLEKMGRFLEAQSVYSENLTNNAPDNWQRQAILKIAELSAVQTNFADAEVSLDEYLSRFPNSTQQDSVLLALGELHLKNYAAWPSSTNGDLSQAQSYFDQVINTYTNSTLLGKAYLDRGWCYWFQQKWPESAADFQTASEELPVSVDLAVARFKLGDAAFRLNSYTNALENYQSVVNDFTNYPIVGKTLGAQALYQTLRVYMDLNDVTGMSNVTAQILRTYPVNDVAEKSILLDGEALSDLSQSTTARELFQKFEQLAPNSEQIPQVELYIAQTYQQENNWSPAIGIYDSWLGRFTNNSKFDDVKYAQAWANFKAGNQTNAFLLFTNFLVEFPTNQYAPIAQWWLGDYYYGQGDWANAEKNYKLVFQNWPSFGLYYPAILMAGRAAMGRQGYADAVAYFDMLTADTNCPPQYDAQALFSLGSVMMQAPSSDTNNSLANFDKARQYFQAVAQLYPASEQAALAWGEIGDCNLQLATQNPQYYYEATNAYTQILDSPFAQVAERSQAQVGIGIVFEKLAALTNGVSQVALQQAALDNYLDVFFSKNLRNGETAVPYWVKVAGSHALPLIDTLHVGDPNEFINQMETLLPQMKDVLEKKRLELSRAKPVS